MIACPKCDHFFYPAADLSHPAADVLRELVELKRMKDAGTTPAEYERRKLIAWREAFRVVGVFGEPKP